MAAFQRQNIPLQSLPRAVLVKWGSKVIDEGFVPFPKRLLRCLGEVFAGPRAIEDLSVVLAVADYMRPNLTRFPSIEYLAFVTGMTVEVVKERIDALIARNLILGGGTDEELVLSLAPLLERVIAITSDTDESHATLSR